MTYVILLQMKDQDTHSPVRARTTSDGDLLKARFTIDKNGMLFLDYRVVEPDGTNFMKNRVNLGRDAGEHQIKQALPAVKITGGISSYLKVLNHELSKLLLAN